MNATAAECWCYTHMPRCTHVTTFRLAFTDIELREESESICIKLSLDILRCLCAIDKQIWWRTDRHGTCDCTVKSPCIGNHVGIACTEPSELTEDDVVSSLSRASFESKWNGWINDIKLLTESIVFGAMCNGRIWLTNEYDGCYCHVSEWVSTNGNDGSVYDTNELWCAHFRVALIFSFFVGVSLVRLPVCDWQTDQTGRRWRRRERNMLNISLLNRLCESNEIIIKSTTIDRHNSTLFAIVDWAYGNDLLFAPKKTPQKRNYERVVDDRRHNNNISMRSRNVLSCHKWWMMNMFFSPHSPSRDSIECCSTFCWRDAMDARKRND